MADQSSQNPKTGKTPAVFTTGSTMRHVVNMTMAGAIGLVSIFAVDLLNLFYISRLGKQELTAAVGYASTIMFFTVSLSIGFTIASTAIVSRVLGAGDIEKSKTDSGTTLIFIAIINIATALIMFPFLGSILSLLGASGYTHEVALDFMRIVTPAIPMMGFGMCCSGLLRARGDAKRAMYVTLSAGIVAAILDPILIFYFELGVRGAAISTVMTRVVLVVVGLYGVWHIHKMIAMPSMQQMSRLFRPYLFIAVPAVLTQVATPVSNAYVTSIMSQFGDGAVTGWAIIGRLVPLAFVAVFTLSAAVGPILGQNLGAQKIDRITATMWNSLLFTFIYTMIMWAILAIFADQIVTVFKLSDEAARLVKFFCLIIGGTYIFQGGLFVANAAFNNLGYPYLSTLFNWGRATIGTIPFVWYGSRWGAEGALAGYGVGGILFGVGAVIVCFRVIRNLPGKAPTVP
ncbi:MAG: MATE family efflux transporter [Rhizobiaceae bacterium]|nr:MATE family efflux transporter [Rhizobiaceae bacterium]